MVSPNQRRNIIIICSVVLLLIFLWLLWLLIPKPKPPVVETPVVETPIATTTPETTSPYTTDQLQKEKETRVQASGVIALSKLFTERYGSYSNEANSQNIRDVIPLMSASFAEATEKLLATRKPSKENYGITTRVITAEVISQDDTAGTATIDLSTQRVEAKGSAQNAVTKYQTIELTFVKESAVWKVDSAIWR